MIINHNLNAMNAHRNMGINTVNSGKSMEKLASGLRINRAGDDAAGLAISEKMRGQIRGLDQAGRNAQDGISMLQTAEGALNETHSIIQRMRELAVQSSNDTNTSIDRNEIQKEINQLSSEINRIGSNTEFNTQKLLNGNKVGTAHTSTGVAVAGEYKIAIGTSDITIDGITITYNAAATGADGNFKDEATFATALATKAALNTSYSAAAGAGIVTLTQKGTQESPNKPVVIGTTMSTVTEGAAAATVRDGAANLQIGANQSQQFTISIEDMRARALGLSGSVAGVYATTSEKLTDASTASDEFALDISTAAKATSAIKVLDYAASKVSSERSKLGAYQNRLEHTIANLGTASENLTSAESRIRDVDMAKEMMSFSKNNILSQAAQAMLAQANQQPQGVLQLLR